MKSNPTGLIWKNNHSMFGAYEATESSPHRRAPARSIKNVDTQLNKQKRKIANATTNELMTNSALLAWAVRKHLDYVSRFEINFRSGDHDLDREVKMLIDNHGRRYNFDIGRRHSRNQWMRIFEMNKILNGDACGIKIRNGGYLQGIDSTQISKPQYWPIPQNAEEAQAIKEAKAKEGQISDHGLILGDFGEVLEYCICARDKQGRLAFSHLEEARNVLFDGYFSNFNQTRGVSPIVAAINDCVDLSDITLYTKINLKLKNIFGMATFRDTADPLGGPADDDEEDGDGSISGTFSPDQINILDLDQNDKVELLETNSPGANAMEFMDKLSRIVMLSLDIPFTSFDSSRASFSARIGDRAEYEESAQGKRDKNAQILYEIYSWRVRSWYTSDPVFKKIADAAGFDADRIVRRLDIISAGTPWLDKLGEVKGDILAIAAGLESTPRLAKKRGVDPYEIGREQAEYLATMKDMGVPIFYANGGQDAVQNILTEDTKEKEEKGNA